MLSLVFVASLALVGAWMPANRTLTSKEGHSLFAKPSGLADSGNSTSNGNLTGKWLPGNLPIRGVNLGSQFIVEPWMASDEWSSMGCGSAESEFDCVTALGQDTANSRFASHWSSWITQGDIQQMTSYGLNTVRIPVGYWIWESLKYDRYEDGEATEL